MAKYNVVFTIKDKYGKDKEVDGGTVEIAIPTFTTEEIKYIEEVLPLEDYLHKSEVNTELDHLATDEEVKEIIKEIKGSLSYDDFEFEED